MPKSYENLETQSAALSKTPPGPRCEDQSVWEGYVRQAIGHFGWRYIQMSSGRWLCCKSWRHTDWLSGAGSGACLKWKEFIGAGGRAPFRGWICFAIVLRGGRSFIWSTRLAEMRGQVDSQWEGWMSSPLSITIANYNFLFTTERYTPLLLLLPQLGSALSEFCLL